MLNDAAIPVPTGDLVTNEEQLQSVIRKIGYPIVIKPLDGNHGKGSSINVNDWEVAKIGLEHAQKYSNKVIVEKYITGYDFVF